MNAIGVVEADGGGELSASSSECSSSNQTMGVVGGSMTAAAVTESWHKLTNNNNSLNAETAAAACNVNGKIKTADSQVQVKLQQQNKKWNCQSCEAVAELELPHDSAAADVGNAATSSSVVHMSVGILKANGDSSAAAAATTTHNELQTPPTLLPATSAAAAAAAQKRAAVAEQNENNAAAYFRLPNDSNALASLLNIVIPESADDEYDEQEFDCGAVGATSLSPPGGRSLSNRTSINNSTENLSYSSDNFYPDDLFLLQGVDDADDRISINSDDCVYAYRGEGADFDFPFNSFSRRSQEGQDVFDDETDFLEMDFEPDPPSEVESTAAGAELEARHAAFFNAHSSQRDTSHLSGRHSVTNLSLRSSQRKLCSSPNSDVSPLKALNSQSQLTKNFALMSLHLDQIKGGEASDGSDDEYERRMRNERKSVMSSKTTDDEIEVRAASAHSLPNTLHAVFVHGGGVGVGVGGELEQQEQAQQQNCAAMKVTGAKPKRFATFSASSSASSKNSSKSRNSLRLAPQARYSSASFDERSASCAEFRSMPRPSEEAANLTLMMPYADVSGNDAETCLDCLEREFLANTIGKAIDANDCQRCRRRLRFYSSSGSGGVGISSNMRSYESRCRSGSPNIFKEECSESMLRLSSEIFPRSSPLDAWGGTQQQSFLRRDAVAVGDSEYDMSMRKCAQEDDAKSKAVAATVEKSSNIALFGRAPYAGPYSDRSDWLLGSNQRAPKCDTFMDKMLSRTFYATLNDVERISTFNLEADALVLALDGLGVSYDEILLRSHFESFTPHILSDYLPKTQCTSFYLFIKRHSKRNNNYKRIKRIIQAVTSNHVNIEFEKDPTITNQEHISVKVTDVLEQWHLTQDLETLQQLDERFKSENILGKIVNIIRLAEQRCKKRKPLPEHIFIPQYYPSGILKLTRKNEYT